MTTLHLTITMREDRAQRLVDLARSLNTSTDLMVQTILDSDMDSREIEDKTMSDSAIFYAVANSPFGNALLSSPTVHHVQGQPPHVDYRVNQQVLPNWERLIINQELGLPMRWNARLVNITTGAVASSDPGPTAEAFLHEELHQALSALHDEMSRLRTGSG